jgi:hypothetical protein
VLDAAACASLFIMFLYVFWPGKGRLCFSVVLVLAAAALPCLVLYFSYFVIIKYCVFLYILTVTVACRPPPLQLVSLRPFLGEHVTRHESQRQCTATPNL